MRITDSQDFDLRFSLIDDMVALRQWLKTEGITHWFPPENDQEIENFVRIWIGFCRYNASLTATYQNKPVGMGILYLMPYRKVAHHAMMQIIVDPEHQSKGVGFSLVKNMKHLAKTQFRLESVHVEVFDESPFIPLLKDLDFTEFARQEKYVKEKSGQYFPRILLEAQL